MAVNSTKRTVCKFLGQEFKVSVREWEDQIFTLQTVCIAGYPSSGTDFEHYRSFDEAHAAGVQLARAVIAGV